MSELAHTAEIEVGAAPEQVWAAITSPALTRRYAYGCDVEGMWRPGTPWRYHQGDRTVVEGTVQEADAPRLLCMSARDIWDPAAAAEPPYRITWRIEPLAEGRSHVRLTADGFETEGASYRNNANLGRLVRGLRNVVDPEVAASLRRLDRIGEPEVLPLTPERLDDFLDLFDGRAFADNPSWEDCYCFNLRFAGGDAASAARTGADNRRDMSDAIVNGRAHGLLAYADGRAVGWCSACPKGEMAELMRRDWMPQESERVGMIGCLVIAPQYRRHGIARRLVAAASDYLAGLGCTVAEAYPLKEVGTDAHGFYGPPAIYRDLGYETYRDLPQRAVVRRRLTP